MLKPTVTISVKENIKDFYNKVNKIKNQERRVIIKLSYIIGSRVSELKQIRKKDCVFTNRSMIISRIILKVKGNPVEPTEINHKDSFVKDIKDFVMKVKDDNHYLFPFRHYVFGFLTVEDPTRHISSRQIQRIVNLELGTWPHYLRHMRFSHVAPHMRSSFEMRTFTHHRTETALNTYIHLMPGIYRDHLPVG